MKKQDVVSIPKEVFIEILRRVPGHDLAEKLKMVCMQWCSIIYTGSFAYSHIEQRIKSSSFSQLEAVVVAFDGDECRSVTISSLEWHSSYNQNDHQFKEWKTKYLFTAKDVLLGPDSLPWMRMIWVNSVNGFWSYSDRVRFHVTKEYRTTAPHTYLGISTSVLLSNNVSIQNDLILALYTSNGFAPFLYSLLILLVLTYITGLRDTHIATAVGFGFCPLSYEYKVAVLDGAGLEVLKPSVFSIGTDHSWRPLKVIPHRMIPQVVTVVFVKGKLYWYSQTCTSTDVCSIHRRTTKTLLCFDVTKEEFDMIVVPIDTPELI